MGKKGRILILGGTGAMGKHVIDLLQINGYDCLVTSRSRHPDTENIKYMVGNAHDDIFLEKILSIQKWDAIIDFMSYSTLEFEKRVNKLLLATNQYVFLSSSRVYAESDKPITEDSPRLLDVSKDKEYLSTDEYALSKARQEDVLSIRDGWTIIRPYITFSERRLQLGPQEKESWLYRALKKRTIVFSEDIANKVTTLTYGYNVAKGIIALLGQKSALGQAFHITSNESFLWKEILSTYCNIIKRECGFLPKVLFRDRWEPYHGGTKSQVKFDRLYNRQFDNSKINKYINTMEFDSTIQSLDNCLTSFIRLPVFQKINWENEAIKDCKTKEWASLKEIGGVKMKVNYVKTRIGL